MHRIWAIIERDLRRFRRSPVLVIVSIIMPLVQLVVLGYAFGGKIKHLHVGVVDEDHGVPAIKIREMCQAVAANAATFDTISYTDKARRAARSAQRQNQRRAEHPAAIFAQGSGRGESAHRAGGGQHRSIFRLRAGRQPRRHARRLTTGQRVPPRTTADVDLSVVEIYPYVPYIQFLLPGTITLSIFVSAMIGGGIIFIDDKARGLHEGYLVTPIRKFELILGFTLAGAAKAIIAGLF